MADNKFDDSLFEDVPFEESAQADADLFEEVPFDEAPAEDEGVSKTESFLRGAAQGATLDFADEIAGAGSTVGSLLTDQRDLPLTEVLDLYRQKRDESRQAFQEAEEANPATFTAGDVAGGIAPALVTGGASVAPTLAKQGLKAAAKVGAKAGAKAGAATALGRTEEITDLPEVAEDVAVGTALGAGFGAAIPSATKGAKKFGEVSGAAIRKASSFVGEVDDNIAKLLQKDKELLAQQLPYNEIADKVLKNVNSSLGDWKNSAKKARTLLSKERTISKEALLDEVDNVLDGISFGDDVARPQLDRLRKYIDKDFPKFMNEVEVQEVLDQLSKKAYSGVETTAPNAVVQGLRNVRGGVSDILKQKNSAYKEAMNSLEGQKKALDSVMKRYGIQEDVNYRKFIEEVAPDEVKALKFKNPDTAVSRLKNLGKDYTDSKFTDKQLLDDVKGLFELDDDVLRNIKANEIGKQLEKGKDWSTQGLTMTKALLGMAINPVVGAAAILAKPAVRNYYRNIHKIPQWEQNIVSKLSNTIQKKTGQVVLPSAGIRAAKSKADEIDSLLSELSESKKDNVRMSEVDFARQDADSLGRTAEEMKKEGFDAFAEGLSKAASTEDAREQAAQRQVLHQQPAFRKLLKRLQKEGKIK